MIYRASLSQSLRRAASALFGVGLWLSSHVTTGAPLPSEPEVEVTYERIEPANAFEQDPRLYEVPESQRKGLAEAHVVYQVRSLSAAATIIVHVNAVPGATLDTIRANFLAGETEDNHHDLVIFQGGKNNALNAGGATATMANNYRALIRNVKQAADARGIPIYFPEVDPISAPILTQRGFNGTQYQTSTLALNTTLNGLADSDGLNVMSVYDAFKPHYNATAEAWCMNLANSSNLDGSHPNATGAREFALTYWNAIAPFVLAQPHRPVSVAIYGDSIMATTYLPEEQRPAAWLAEFSRVSAVQDWTAYP